MNISKEVLLQDFSGVYAAGSVCLKNRRYYAFASENRGGCLYLAAALTGKVSRIEGCSGGVMAVIDSIEEDAFICIEEFYPVFDSKTAKLIRYTVSIDEDQVSVNRELIAEVPYIHRVAQFTAEGEIYLAAGRLCRQKAFVEDWTSPGSMEIAGYDSLHPESVRFQVVCDDIYKHHALWVKNAAASGNDEIYYGGTEGVFHTWKAGDSWKTEHILDVPTSDIAVVDLDGDGEEELAIIEGFHGNKCVVFKKYTDEWTRVWEFPLEFGHVLWGGSFLGEPALIMGSRAGNKDLVLARFHSDKDGAFQIKEKTVIDSGQAPAQIFVIHEECGETLIAANHGAAQAAVYRIS